MEEKSSSSGPSLIKQSFESVESFYPGFTEFFIRGVLAKAQVEEQIDMPEAILK